MAEELRIKLPAASVTKFHPKLPSGTISKKVHHAVPQLFAKTFLQHFFARSPLVLQHSHESLELDSAMRGGTLGVAGAVVDRNAQVAADPVAQAAQLRASALYVGGMHAECSCCV